MTQICLKNCVLLWSGYNITILIMLNKTLADYIVQHTNKIKTTHILQNNGSRIY